MVGTSLNILVLRGVNVVRDVVTSRMGLDTVSANAQAPAATFLSRHPMQGRRPMYARAQRCDHAGNPDVNSIAQRAGRPGSPAGASACRMPAQCAGGIIRPRWSLCVGGPRFTGERLSRFTALAPASVTEALHERLYAKRVSGLAAGRWLPTPVTPQARKHAAANRIDVKSGGGTHAVAAGE